MQSMRSIDSVIVRRMEGMVQRHSAEHIQHLFGISLNTWAKLRQGEPIRASVAERLLERLARQYPPAGSAGETAGAMRAHLQTFACQVQERGRAGAA